MKKYTVKNNLEKAASLFSSGELQKAASICKKAVKHTPKNDAANFLLGKITAQQGDQSEAIRYFSLAIEQKKTDPNYLFYRGRCYYTLKRYIEALNDFNLAVSLAPDSLPLRMITGHAARDAGDFSHAFDMYTEALRISPDNDAVLENLARVCELSGKLQDVVKYYRKAIEVAPENVSIMNNFGSFLYNHNNSGLAIYYLKRTLEIDPKHSYAHNNMGSVLCELREIRAACTSFENALKYEPDFSQAHSNLLLTIHYDTLHSAEDVLLKHLSWEKAQASGLLRVQQSDYRNDPTVDRKLRIGYVSSDFRSHSVAYFIYPVLQAHLKDKFDIYCFSNVEKPDAFTQKIQSISGIFWKNIRQLSDQETVELIMQEKIDILIDLSGHTAAHRLKVFAQKPAPVQINYLGYPDTTGLSTIDYRFTDRLADPIGETDYLHTEKLCRLSRGFLCYQPPESCPEPAPQSPMRENGYVTFGSFNKFTKINHSVVTIWSRLLNSVPHSKLLIKSKNLTGLAEKRLLAEFAKHGIEKDRIIRSAWIPTLSEHLELYSKIDIALDTFPYNGTTTTFEALWMGKPVITLTGETHVTRVGYSILSRLGLDELITYSPEEYIDRCIQLAGDVEHIQQISETLRQRLTTKGMLDSDRFTRELESCYQRMFRAWSHQHTESSHMLTGRRHKINSGIEICLPDTLHEYTTYRLLEQESIDKDLLQFLRRLPDSGGTVIDTCCGYGDFALTVATLRCNEGLTLALDTSLEKLDFLQKSISINLLENCRAIHTGLDDQPAPASRRQEEQSSRSSDEISENPIALDAIVEKWVTTSVDFIRIQVTSGLEAIFNRAVKTLSEHSPLLLLEIDNTAAAGECDLEPLIHLGYSFFSLLPGKPKLVPFIHQNNSPLPAMLFACRESTAARLWDENLLTQVVHDTAIPTVSQGALLERLSSMYPHARLLYEKWSSSPSLPDWEIYWAGLNTFLDALETNEVTSSYSHLLKSHALLSHVCDTNPTFQRLLTLTRVAYEAGFKDQALNLSRGLLDFISSDSSAINLASEPFIAPAPRFDSTSPGAFEGNWLLAAILEQIEMLQYSSSYFGDQNDLLRLEMIDSSGFGSAEMQRRRQLLLCKLGLQKSLIPCITLSRPAKDNINYMSWSR